MTEGISNSISGSMKSFRQSYRVLVVLALTLTMTVSGSLIACNQSSSAAHAKQDIRVPEGSSPKQLEVIDWGYSRPSDEHSYYCIVVHNPNIDYAAKTYTVLINEIYGRDGRTVLIEYTMQTILPGETQYFGFDTIPAYIAPDSVELTASAADSDWVKTDQKFVGSYAITNTSETMTKPFVLRYTGEIIALDEDRTGTVWITVVMFMDDDKIVYCGSTRVYDVSVDQATPFEFYVDHPALHSSYRMYAIRWYPLPETPEDIPPEQTMLQTFGNTGNNTDSITDMSGIDARTVVFTDN